MNKFEVYLNQAKHDEYILNKLKSEINKYDASIADMKFADKDIYINRINSILQTLRKSRVINKVEKLNEGFDYEKLSQQYKKLYDNVVLNNFFNEEIKSFSERFMKSSMDFPTQLEECTMMIDENIYLENTELDALYKLRQIREINTNMVVVGKNGSGKSSFINSFRDLIDSNIYTVNADRILSYEKKQHQGIPYADEMKKRFEQVFKKNDIHNIDTNFEVAIKYLIKHDTIENQIPVLNRKTTKVFSIMNNVFPYLDLKIDPQTEEIKVQDVYENVYKLNEMSSGEKSALYLITIIMLAEKNSYFLIDEPEINLNPYLSRKLWDILEREKEDSVFIYATHDRDFASSRINSTYIWNRKFKYPNVWQQEIIKDIEVSKELLFDLLGEADQKFLIEGTYDSLDYNLFKILFNDKQIVPLGGHLQVIQSQRAINSAQMLYLETKSIIDRDFYPDKELDGLSEKNIYALPYNEIENLIYKIAIENLDKLPSSLKDRVNRIEKEYIKYFLTQVDYFSKEIIKYEMQFLIEDVREIGEAFETIDEIKVRGKEENFIKFFDFEKKEIKDLDLMLKKIPLKESMGKDVCKSIINFIEQDDSIQRAILKDYFNELQ